MSAVRLVQCEHDNPNSCSESSREEGSRRGCRRTLVRFVCGVEAPDLEPTRLQSVQQMFERKRPPRLTGVCTVYAVDGFKEERKQDKRK